MPSDTPALAAQGLELSLLPTLPRRLMSWIARLSSPRCASAPATGPTCARGILQQILSRHPQARGVFVNLAAVESQLQSEGDAGLAELTAETLERARAELLSIFGAPEVQPLLALLAEPCRPQPAQRRAPALATRANAATALPQIENLEVHELDEQAYLTAVLEWEKSGPTGIGQLMSRQAV